MFVGVQTLYRMSGLFSTFYWLINRPILNTTKAPIFFESIFNLPLLRKKQEIVFLSKVEVPPTNSKRIDFFVMSAFIN
ncbi:hypothetical protein BSK60_02745 [Paenibacillus odorifer]|nr:hypothetical protein BSK60_02745 [Paenibacillus odorifer]